MAKELPYFRFTVQEWQNGKISLESYELQGLFINVCCYYWINDCSITLAMLKKRFRDANHLLDELINLGILKHERRHDKIKIDFLIKQYELLSEKRKRRQEAGSKGGNAKAMLKQKCSYKDKDKDIYIDIYKEKEKEKKKINKKEKEKEKRTKKEKEKEIPTLETFLEYAKEECSKVGRNYEALRYSIEAKYESWKESGWKDGHGKVIKNWKTKLKNTLPYLKEINQTKNQNQNQNNFSNYGGIGGIL